MFWFRRRSCAARGRAAGAPVCPNRARSALLLHEIGDGDAEARRELSYGLRLARAAARDCADVCARDATASSELRFAHAAFGKKLLNLLRIYNHFLYLLSAKLVRLVSIVLYIMHSH